MSIVVPVVSLVVLGIAFALLLMGERSEFTQYVPAKLSHHWATALQYLGLALTPYAPESGLSEARQVEAFDWAWRNTGLALYFSSQGYDPRGPAALAAHESGWGLSRAARRGDNLWGVSDNDQPRVYASLDDAVHDLVQVLAQPRYAGPQAVRGIGVAWLRGLHECGYNSNESWLAGVLAAYERLQRV
jgi:hypothetical protein